MANSWKRESYIENEKLVVTAIELKEDGSPAGKTYTNKMDLTTTNLAEEIMKRLRNKIKGYEDRKAIKESKLPLIETKLVAVDKGNFTNYVRGEV
jgi:hypothetical protein